MSTYNLDHDVRFNSNLANNECDYAKCWFITEWAHLPSSTQDTLLATFFDITCLNLLVINLTSNPSPYLVEVRVNSLCVSLIRCARNDTTLTSFLV